MTESEWLTATDPTPMLEFIVDKAGARKGRLLACAECRLRWPILYHSASRNAVEVAEMFCDGEADLETLSLARYHAETPTFGYDLDGTWTQFVEQGEVPQSIHRLVELGVLSCEGYGLVMSPESEAMQVKVCWGARWAYESAFETDGATLRHILATHKHSDDKLSGCWLIREIFGNPFSAPAFDPSFRTATVVAIATQMYESRDFTPIGVLADALEDAGCQDASILEHLRCESVHVRGCWVIDLILGKA